MPQKIADQYAKEYRAARGRAREMLIDLVAEKAQCGAVMARIYLENAAFKLM